MSTENQWLEDVFPIELVPFWGTWLIFRGVQTLKIPFPNYSHWSNVGFQRDPFLQVKMWSGTESFVEVPRRKEIPGNSQWQWYPLGVFGAMNKGEKVLGLVDFMKV